MSAPGAGQGVSWVDVAASAAGIYRQMQTIGTEAAAGFASSFNQGVGSHGSAMTSSLGHVGASAGSAAGKQFESAFMGFIGRVIPGGEKLVEAFATHGSNAGKSMSKNFMNEFDAGLSTLGTSMAHASTAQAETAFKAAGVRSGEMFSQEFTAKVANSLTTLGGVNTANLEQALGAAGVKGGAKYAQGLAAGLETLGGASMADAVNRVMNGLAVHGGDIFVSGFANKVSAGMQVLEGGNIAANLVKSLGVAGDVAGGIFSKQFFERYEIGLKNLGATAAPSLAQLITALKSTGLVAGEEANKIGQYFKAQLEALAQQAVPSLAAIKTQFREMGAGTEAEIADMAGMVRASLFEIGSAATASSGRIKQVMSDAALVTGAAWSGTAENAIEGWLAKMEASMKVSGQTLARAAGMTGTAAAKQFWEDFATVLEAEAGTGAVTAEVMEKALAKVGAGDAGVQAASSIAGNMLGALKQHLNTGLAPIMESAAGMLTKLGGAAGLGGGMAIAGGIAAAILVGGELILSNVKNVLKLVNDEVSAFGKVGKEAADTLMEGFKSVVEGKMPDVGKAFGVFEEMAKTSIELPLNAMKTEVDNTVGRIPLIGEAFKMVGEQAEQALGAAFAVIDEYKSIATEFGNVILDIGEKWQEAGRAIAGQTLGTENLELYLETVRDIAASGDLVHFKDVADIVGELHQRLEGLGEGAGVTKDQLTELATTLAEGNELLGNIHINVDNLTSAFNSFNVEPEKTNEELEYLVNLSRMTGAAINDLTKDLDNTSPAWQALGFNMDEASFIMAKINEELGRPAMERFGFSLARLPEELDKSGVSLDGFNDVIKGYLASADKVGEQTAKMDAIKFVMGFGIAAKAAENMVDLIGHGIPFSVNAAGDAVAANGAKLKEPLSEALEVTKSFKDELEVLSNSVQAALAPMGMGLVEALNGVGDKISNWMQLHQGEFIGFVGAIGEKLLDWGAKISHFLATMLRDMSGFVEAFKDMVVLAVGAVDLAFVAFTAPFQLIPDFVAKMDPTGFTGAMKGMAQGATEALGPLKSLFDMDVSGAMNTAASGVDALGSSLAGMEGPLADLVSKSQDAASMWEGFRATFAKPLEVDGKQVKDEFGNVKMEAAKLQDALGSMKEGADDAMKIDPAALDAVRDQLGKLGITVDADAATGKIKSFSAHTQKELDDLEEYLNTRFGPDEFAKLGGEVKFTVATPPGKSVEDYLKDNIGVPSEMAGPDGIHAKVFLDFDKMNLSPELKKQLQDLLGGTPGVDAGTPSDSGPSWEAGPNSLGKASGGDVTGGHGGIDDVPAMLTTGEKVMTVAANQRFGPMLDAMNAGRGPRGYAAGGTVRGFADGGTVLDAAGVPSALRNSLTGQGIALPAGINVLIPQPMTEADTMSRAGVPDKLQGDVESGGATVPGVSLPTALAVKEGDRQDVTDVMTAVGIPSSLQDSDGVKVGVKLSLVAGDTLPDGGLGTGTSTSTSTSSTGSTGPGPGGDVQNQVMAALRTGGFAGAYGLQAGGFAPGDYGNVSNIIGPESSWSTSAVNNSDINAQQGNNSVGLGQLTLSNYRANGFPQVTSVAAAQALTPYQQASAMMSYIRGRYGTPAAAWAHWQINRNYHTGGPTEAGPAELQDDEHVLTRDEVTAAGGHGAIQNLRKKLRGLQGGGDVSLWQQLLGGTKKSMELVGNALNWVDTAGGYLPKPTAHPEQHMGAPVEDSVGGWRSALAQMLVGRAGQAAELAEAAPLRMSPEQGRAYAEALPPPSSPLTAHEKFVVGDYTANPVFNNLLREHAGLKVQPGTGPNLLDEWERQQYGNFGPDLKSMDSAIAKHPPLPDSIVVTRVVDKNAFGGITDHSALVGKTFPDAGFMSTSMGTGDPDAWMLGLLEGVPNRITPPAGSVYSIEMTLPKGTRGVYASHSNPEDLLSFTGPGQNEFITQRGGSFTVTGAEMQPNGHIAVKATFNPPKETPPVPNLAPLAPIPPPSPAELEHMKALEDLLGGGAFRAGGLVALQGGGQASGGSGWWDTLKRALLNLTTFGSPSDQQKKMLGLQGGGLLDPGQNPVAPGSPGFAMTEDYAIIQACLAEGVDPSVWLGPMKTLISRESGGGIWGRWDPGVTQHGYRDVNTGGNEAEGAAQVTPGTAKQVGIDPKSLFDPINNIRASIRHIKGTYAGPHAPRRGKGGLGKDVPPDQSIFNVQQADPLLPPMGYQEGGSTDGSLADAWLQGKGASLFGGLLKGILGEIGITLPTSSGSGTTGSLWDTLGTGHDGTDGTTGMQTGGHVQGTWWPGRDSVPMGLQPGSFVVNRNRSSQYRDVLDGLMGSPGGATGTHGRTVPTILEVGERVVPPHIAMPNAGLLWAINSGNLQGHAGGGVAQVIYNPPGTKEFYGEASPYGRVGPGTSQPQYYQTDWGGHHGHVHTSFDTGPDGMPYGMPPNTNLPATGKESAGFPPWVYQLGRQYGVYASTYPGHQVHGGKNHGLDWWPLGKADMSGLSYTPEETNRLRRFASAVENAGAGGAANWGSGYSGSAYAASTSSSGLSIGTGAAFSRSRLRALLPPWLANALGIQGGGMLGMEGGGPVIVPSPSGMLGGDGDTDPQPGDDDVTTRLRKLLADALGGRSSKNPNDQVPQPTAPGAPQVEPPPSWDTRVAPGTPGAVDVPGYGSFVYSFNLPQDQQDKMNQDQRYKLDQWLAHAEDAASKSVKTQQGVDTANQAEQDATIRLGNAKTNYANQVTAITKDLQTQQQKDDAIRAALANASSPLAKAQTELTSATDAESTARLNAGNASAAQTKADRDAQIQAESKPPWEGGKGKTTPDANAAQLGSGLVKGIAQEFGFGDVFAKPPWEWGIWKLFAGGASFGLNLLNNMGDAAGDGGGGFFGGSGPAPGGDGTAPALPPGDQHMPGPGGGPDDQGAYLMPDGVTKDVPDSDGGYAKSHGPDWTYDANTKRFYPPGKGPSTQQPVPQTTGGEQGGEKGDGKTWHFQDNWKQEVGKDGKPIGPRIDVKTNQPLPGQGAPPAKPPPPKYNPTAPLQPGTPPPTTPGQVILPGSPANPPGFTPPPPALYPQGVVPQASAYRTVDDSGNQVQLASLSTPSSSGGDIGLGNFMDWMMHPARNAMQQAMARGDIPGPPWAASVTPQMAASQAPANVPAPASVGATNIMNVSSTNNGVLQGADQAAALVTGAQVRRSGFHPSMKPASV